MVEQGAQIQIYTLSNIRSWRLCREGTPRRSWERYNSAIYDFENWVQINEVDFRRVAVKMKDEGNLLFIGHEASPFYLTGAHFSPPRRGSFYLFRSSVVALFPKEGKYVMSPESPHFGDRHLLENINLILFSEARERLEEVAGELDLPLTVKVEG